MIISYLIDGLLPIPKLLVLEEGVKGYPPEIERVRKMLKEFKAAPNVYQVTFSSDNVDVTTIDNDIALAGVRWKTKPLRRLFATDRSKGFNLPVSEYQKVFKWNDELNNVQAIGLLRQIPLYKGKVVSLAELTKLLPKAREVTNPKELLCSIQLG